MEKKIDALLLCFSESELNYNANHQGLYINICGVNPKYWDSFLSERGINTNSILAGYTIYQHFIDKTGSKTKALKEYKGIEKNKWIIKKYKKVEKQIKSKHLKESK
jgi:hypothetical protein